MVFDAFLATPAGSETEPYVATHEGIVTSARYSEHPAGCAELWEGFRVWPGASRTKFYHPVGNLEFRKQYLYCKVNEDRGTF